MNTITVPNIPQNANWSTMEHLGGWYAGHVIPGMAYVYCTDVLTDSGQITKATFRVCNEVDTEIGSVTWSEEPQANGGWSFTKVGEVRIPLDEV